MIQNIQKDTFVDANEATARALTYDLFKGLYEKVDHLLQCHEDHMRNCEHRFEGLEGRKIKDIMTASIAGLLGGIGAGFLALYNHIFGK
jgi:hypothetical protein